MGHQPRSVTELPDRQPDVTGVVGTGDKYPGPPYLVEPSDSYYLGMSLLLGDPVVVRSQDGEAVANFKFGEGDEVAVWIGDGCRETFPVQCDVIALQVTNAAS